MHIDLDIRNIDLASVLRNYADRQLRFVLSRFGHRVGRVVVTLSPINRQGKENNCQVSVDLLPFGRVATEEADSDLYAAIDRGVGRLGRLLTSRLGRERNEVRRPELGGGRNGTQNRRSKVSNKEPRRSFPRTVPNRHSQKDLRNRWNVREGMARKECKPGRRSCASC